MKEMIPRNGDLFKLNRFYSCLKICPEALPANKMSFISMWNQTGKTINSSSGRGNPRSKYNRPPNH